MGLTTEPLPCYTEATFKLMAIDKGVIYFHIENFSVFLKRRFFNIKTVFGEEESLLRLNYS